MRHRKAVALDVCHGVKRHIRVVQKAENIVGRLRKIPGGGKDFFLCVA